MPVHITQKRKSLPRLSGLVPLTSSLLFFTTALGNCARATLSQSMQNLGNYSHLLDCSPIYLQGLLASVGSLLKYNSLETLYPSSFTKIFFCFWSCSMSLVYISSSNALLLISLLFPHTLVSIINSTQ